MALIDHKRLTQAESRLLRMMLSVLFFLAGFIVTTAIIVRLVPAPVEGHAVSLVSQETPAPIAEDDPGWRCDTMGNRVCGVPNGNGQFVLVCHDVTGYPIRVVYDPFACV